MKARIRKSTVDEGCVKDIVDLSFDKEYEVRSSLKDGTFVINDDSLYEIICRKDNCAHLYGGKWEFIN